MNIGNYYSNGKLLITGEYAILEGAKGLAIPTVYGQDLKVRKHDEPLLEWHSFDKDGQTWFKARFDLPHLNLISVQGDHQVAFTLRSLFDQIRLMNPDFIKEIRA